MASNVNKIYVVLNYKNLKHINLKIVHSTIIAKMRRDH